VCSANAFSPPNLTLARTGADVGGMGVDMTAGQMCLVTFSRSVVAGSKETSDWDDVTHRQNRYLT